MAAPHSPTSILSPVFNREQMSKPSVPADFALQIASFFKAHENEVSKNKFADVCGFSRGDQLRTVLSRGWNNDERIIRRIWQEYIPVRDGEYNARLRIRNTMTSQQRLNLSKGRSKRKRNKSFSEAETEEDDLLDDIPIAHWVKELKDHLPSGPRDPAPSPPLVVKIPHGTLVSHEGIPAGLMQLMRGKRVTAKVNGVEFTFTM
jgi:hypothetical protein